MCALNLFGTPLATLRWPTPRSHPGFLVASSLFNFKEVSLQGCRVWVCPSVPGSLMSSLPHTRCPLPWLILPVPLGILSLLLPLVLPYLHLTSWSAFFTSWASQPTALCCIHLAEPRGSTLHSSPSGEAPSCQWAGPETSVHWAGPSEWELLQFFGRACSYLPCTCPDFPCLPSPSIQT